MKKLVTLFALASVYVAMPAHAETKAECQAMVEEAAAFCNENPTAKCFAEINTGTRFKKGELFIFAFDFSGKSLANGGIPTMIGKNMANAMSADGQRFIQEQIKVAKGGSGWLEFDWVNPKTQTVMRKIAYVKKVNAQFYVGSGIHK